MSMIFPRGSRIKDVHVILPADGGMLTVSDNEGNIIREWALDPIVDDFSKPIPNAKYEIAVTPAPIPAPHETHER